METDNVDWIKANRISGAIDRLRRYNQWLMDPESFIPEYRPDLDLKEAQRTIASIVHRP